MKIISCSNYSIWIWFWSCLCLLFALLLNPSHINLSIINFICLFSVGVSLIIQYWLFHNNNSVSDLFTFGLSLPFMEFQSFSQSIIDFIHLYWWSFISTILLEYSNTLCQLKQTILPKMHPLIKLFDGSFFSFFFCCHQLFYFAFFFCSLFHDDIKVIPLPTISSTYTGFDV